MNSKRLNLEIGLSVILVLVMLLVACGPTPAPTSVPPTEVAPAPTEAAPAPTEAAPAPTEAAQAPTEAAPSPTEAATPTVAAAGQENVATYVYPRTINELDPSLVLSSENNILWNVYGNLTIWTQEKGVQPYLAESWESSEDALDWTFHLRPGLKCHDGTDLTAEDVKFSYERTIEKGALAYVFAPFDTIEAVDPLTVQIKLKYPARLDALLANNWGTFIMCRSVADKPEEWFAAGNEDGAGPYTIESFEPGQRLVLSAFKDWYAGWQPGQFDKVVIQIVEDPAVRVQMLRGGEGDIAWGIPFDDFATLNATGDVKAIAIPAYQQLQWHMNTRRAPLDDLRVRQALAYAFPYEAAAQGTYGGYATPAKGAVPRLMWTPPVETKIYNYDPEKAKQLLEEAGVPKGTKIRLAVEVNQREALLTAQLWQAELAKLGIDLSVEEVSAGVRWDEVYNPDTEYNIMFMGMVIGYDSPNEYLGSVWHSKWTWFPFSGFASEDFDKLDEEALSLEAVDKDKSDRLYQQAEQILFDNAVAVFALDLPQDFAVRTDIQGFEPNPLYGYEVFLWELSRQ
jgi:peptide/nickel transport system substrate-binding protein